MQIAKRVLLEGLGWILVLVGLAALVLPGPGLLALFAGVTLLATQYEWAERRLDRVKAAALRTAADGVKTWPRILTSCAGVLSLVAIGTLWCVHPPAPSWWPLDDGLWLVGGWGTGATLIGSGIIAGVMVVYSYLNFREIKGDEMAADELDEGQRPVTPR